MTLPKIPGPALGLALLFPFSVLPCSLLASEPLASEPSEATPKDEKPKWSVAEPPLPTYEISIDVREGTWLSLDVAPDGSEIVFDLLGDLYLLAAAGGEARALTQGLSWDMQPRFSPDGKTIAFTSDRDGGDNVWLIDRDGANPRAVTKEDFRLPSSPAWTPDGQYLVARKHFTSSRSLGAGEMWLYHRSGGEGVQLTTKANDQKDAGEPAFSPDGRYLYFSQDTTPGATFDYNKDPNGAIYAIQRLDRETGEIVTLVSGPGGAIRPTPSPDGNFLAFIRRVRFESTLFLLDLASGKETALRSGLDRDMQETWAVHGVYPGMAWTPDSRAIVFWAGGKIHRLDVATGSTAEIPFHVQAKHRMVEALRFPQVAATPHFHTRQLRWVEVSPAGDRVVFQALGHLWVRQLPDGQARRLTRQDDHFEFFPAFSRDGRSIVYTTWNDETLGSVRVAPATGGEGRVLTNDPGHYVEPAVSPDGSIVVYRKIEGGFLRTPTWSFEPGIYRVPFVGGDATKVTTDGVEPHFGAAGDRIFLRRSEAADEGKTRQVLVSVNLDGDEPRSLASTEWAAEFRVSPDERWLAFTERYQAYVAPLPITGKGLELGPAAKALPVARVSKDAGEGIRWSGDSSSLLWALGPQLFERKLSDAFAFLDGAPEVLPEAPASGRDLGFDAETYVPPGAVAFVGGRILTFGPAGVIEDGTVVVRNGEITAVGPRGEIAVPAGARVVELAGRTLMPGIVDVHWHGSQGDDEMQPQQNWNNYATLAFGVTTIHDPSNDTSEIFAAAEMARAGLIVAPRIFSTGTILYGARTSFTAEVEEPADALGHLRRLKAAGAFSVKSYNQPRRDQRQKVVAAGHELGMLVVPEGGSLLQHNLTMIADGHTGIEHSIPVAKIYDDVRQFWAQSKTGYTPTLVVGYGGIWGENYFYDTTDVWTNERLLAFVPRRLVDERSRRRVKAPPEEYNHISNATIAAELVRLGVGVQVGAHGQREGLGAHWEIWSFVQGGMAPLEALRAATLGGAQYLGLDGQLGSVEAGKLADLVVFERDPLADIRNSEHVGLVMVAGRLFDAATMREIGGREQARKAFYFEGEGGIGGCSTAVCAGPASARCAH